MARAMRRRHVCWRKKKNVPGSGVLLGIFACGDCDGQAAAGAACGSQPKHDRWLSNQLQVEVVQPKSQWKTPFSNEN